MSVDVIPILNIPYVSRYICLLGGPCAGRSLQVWTSFSKLRSWRLPNAIWKRSHPPWKSLGTQVCMFLFLPTIRSFLRKRVLTSETPLRVVITAQCCPPKNQKQNFLFGAPRTEQLPTMSLRGEKTQIPMNSSKNCETKKALWFKKLRGFKIVQQTTTPGTPYQMQKKHHIVGKKYAKNKSPKRWRLHRDFLGCQVGRPYVPFSALQQHPQLGVKRASWTPGGGAGSDAKIT